MDETSLWFAAIALFFLVVLGIEWRYRSKTLRIGAAILALNMLWFFQPLYHSAWRRAIAMPPAERITHSQGIGGSQGRLLTEYESGVFTMYEAVGDVGERGTKERAIALGVLFWLACSPVLRRRDTPQRGSRAVVGAGATAPEA